MQLLPNMTLVLFRPSTTVNHSGSNVYFLQTPTGETIPFEFGLLNLPPCMDIPSPPKTVSAPNTTSFESHHGENIQAVIYVGVVLLVYAFIIMMMIATNIRRQRLEGEDADYYEEFLQKRDHFKYAQLVAEARMSVEPHVKRAASINPSNPLFSVEQFQISSSPLMGSNPGAAPAIVIQAV